MDVALLLNPGIGIGLALQGLVRGAMYALMGVGLSLIFGILGVVNFAHGELFMIGAYVVVLVSVYLGLPFIVGVACAGIVLFLFGALLERGLITPLRRRAGRDWLMDSFVLTIGLMVILQNLAQILFGGEHRGVTDIISGALSIGPVTLSYDRVLILGVAILVALALWLFIKTTSLGKAIRATAQAPEAAQTLGIDIGRMYAVAFGIGAALAGIAGALLISIYTAYPTVGMEPVLKSFAVVILGGLGNIPGAIVAGLLLGLVEAFSGFLASSGWQNVITALLVVLILIFRPAGLFVLRGARP